MEDPLTQNTLSDPLNNIICEGYGCFKKAATKIKVRVGKLGSISLDLCTDCVKKFYENYNTANTNSDVIQKIVKNELDKSTCREVIKQ